MKAPDITSLRSFIKRVEPERLPAFEDDFEAAEEVIVIGSATINQLGRYSDLDLIFVGSGERLKTPHLDFIWVRPPQLESQSWLGSELANHAAHYGKWIKGQGAWRRDVFIGEFAIKHKCERILIRLSRVYLKRRSLGPTVFIELLSRCVLDMQRALFLSEGKAPPPTPEVVKALLAAPEKTFDLICDERLLGDLGRYFLREFIPCADVVAFLRKAQDKNTSLEAPSTSASHREHVRREGGQRGL